MKRCPFCAGPSEIRWAYRGRPFVQCIAERCGAASKPADTKEGAVANWLKQVRAREGVPSDWRLFAVAVSEAA